MAWTRSWSNAGPFLISWHGLFTFVAVAAAVALTVYWGRKEGMSADAVYSVALWCIIGGIIGARTVHVIDFWGEIYRHDPVRVLYVWGGGIGIFGAILGGFIGGAAYIKIRNSDWFINAWGRWFRFMANRTALRYPALATWPTWPRLRC